MANARKKIKAPNYHAMIFAAIILAMLFMFVERETTMYEDISVRRNQVAESVKGESFDWGAIQEKSEQCTRDLEELKDMSRLGNFLVECDKSDLGRVGNYGLIYAPRCFAIYLVFFILRNFYRIVGSFFDKGKYSRNSKEQQ